jgi:hypothetical protein
LLAVPEMNDYGAATLKRHGVSNCNRSHFMV